MRKKIGETESKKKKSEREIRKNFKKEKMEKVTESWKKRENSVRNRDGKTKNR